MILRHLHRAAASHWFAYPAIAALQLKVMWLAWVYRDLVLGDTIAYYQYATWWVDRLQVNLVWSPLYTAFLGTVLAAVPDVPTAMILHRLLIALAASLLVLALMRRLLPPWAAWLVAAWWTVLPINFETMSEVHLFAALPLLGAFWLIAAIPGPRGRGLALGLLLVATLLVRNETVFAYVALAGFHVLRDIRRRPAGTSVFRVLRPYALPSLAALLLFAFFYSRSVIKFPTLWEGYGPKHTVNMCQVFATGYRQRHPEWVKNPMTECAELMVSHFRAPAPTLRQMIRRNPRAVAVHFAWNASLLPNGLQLMLFDRMWGTVNPDYFPVRGRSIRALVLSVLSVGLALVAVMVVRAQPRWRRWLRRRGKTWAFMLGTTLPLATLVVLTQRPRPSYLFTLSVVLMGLVGMAAVVVARTALGKRRPELPVAALAALLILFAPRHYQPDPADRYLLRLYRRMDTVSDLLTTPKAVLMTRHFAGEIAFYCGRALPRTAEYGTPRLTTDELSRMVEAQAVNVLYVDERLAYELGAQAPFVDPRSPPSGWELVGMGDAKTGPWRIWARSAFVDATRPRPPS